MRITDLQGNISGHDIFSDAVAKAWEDYTLWLSVLQKTFQYRPQEFSYEHEVAVLGDFIRCGMFSLLICASLVFIVRYINAT